MSGLNPLWLPHGPPICIGAVGEGVSVRFPLKTTSCEETGTILNWAVCQVLIYVYVSKQDIHCFMRFCGTFGDVSKLSRIGRHWEKGE